MINKILLRLVSVIKKKSTQLFLTSTLALYLELIVIRWLGSEIRIFAFLKNIPLIISFLGLGLGIMSRKPRLSTKKILPAIVIILVISLAISPFTFISRVPIPTSEDLFIWQSSESFIALFHSPKFLINLLFFLYITIIAFFLSLIFSLFFGLGEILKEKLSQFSPLRAYSIDLLGSMTGVIIFTITSFLETSPFLWLIIVFLILFAIVHPRKINIIVSILVLLIVLFMTKGSYWSPYYKISIYKTRTTDKLGPISLAVNQAYFQRMIDLSPAYLEKNQNPETEDFSINYNLPYWLIDNPGNVLIVGSGTGNDVAAAIRHNAKTIDAVEIDPVILKLGTQLHPEQPYLDKRVTAIVDDARSYFEKTDKKYDTIVYGLLDSHTSTSTFSNIRLDNFVYTKESFQAANKHLKENGNVVVGFAAGKPWILNRINFMLKDVFGYDPLIFKRHKNADGAIFIVSKNISENALSNNIVQQRKVELEPEQSSIVPTDDWPYLYLKSKSIPKLFLFTLSLVVLLFFVLSYIFLGKHTLFNIFALNKERWHFFFLGVAFLLIEIKSINEFSLLFGSTWIVNSMVILGILIMALLANTLIRHKVKTPFIFIISGLFFSLILGYLIKVSSLSGEQFVVKFIGGAILSALPLFFSGLLFSHSFQKTKHTTEVFGANLFGAFVGGMVENVGMITGIRNLTFFSLLFYTIAVLLYRKR